MAYTPTIGWDFVLMDAGQVLALIGIGIVMAIVPVPNAAMTENQNIYIEK